jgi:outer membrane protein insertion porin family
VKEIERRAESQRPVLQQYSTVARELVDNLMRSVNNAVEVSERMNGLVNEAPEVSQKQIGRADRVFDDVLTRMERIGKSFEVGAAKLFRETQGIPAATRTALGVFLGHHSTPTPGGSGTRNSPLSGWLILVALLSTFRGLTPVLNAQQPNEQVSYEGQKVAVVKLVAKPGVDVEALRPLAVQKEGEAYSAEKVQSTVAALQQTGQFSKIDVEVTPEATGLRVMFVMQPVYYVGMINFPGALETFSYPRLLQVVNYPTQEPYDESRVKAAEPALQRFFANNGYFAAQVESETKLDHTRQLVDVVFHVVLNKRAKFGRVEVTGLPPEEATRLERALRSFGARLKGASLKEGKPYDQERLQAATSFIRNNLRKEDRLANEVRLEPPSYDPETNRADVTFQVTLGPKVSVEIAGAHVWKRTQRQRIPIYEENAFDRDLVEEGERNLTAHFQSKGYFNAKVNADIREDPSQLSVVYHIQKGERHRVTSVSITGNRHLDEDDLLEQVVIQKGRFFSRGKFDQDLLKRSVNNLEAFYRNAGFADVHVEAEVIDRESQIEVDFKIVEGEPTLVESLQFEGNKSQAVAALAPGGLNLKPGQPYSRSRLDQDRNQIVANYLNLGYLNVDFKSTVKPLADNSRRVLVTYLIEEGPQARIGQVAYLGGQHTRQSFVRRNTDLTPGAPLSQGKLLESESNLYNLGPFDWAAVIPRKPITDQNQEEVLVKVHEAKRNSLAYGFGFEYTPLSASLSSGVVVLPGLPTVSLPPSFQVIQKNVFSPLGSIEYSRLNLRGRGETASIATFISRLDQRASFTYLHPQFRGLNWNGLWSFSVERTTQNPLFTARLGQGSFQIERILDAAKTKRLQFRYTYQRTVLTHLLIQNFIPPEDQSVRSSMPSVSFVRDTRDKPLDAHKGAFQTIDFSIGPKLFGSSHNVVRLFGQAAYYRQVKPWLVWANSVRLGVVKSFAGSHVPVSQRFFSGGSDSLRGFPLNGAGPQGVATLCTEENDPSTCTAQIRVPVGGQQLFILNSEARFPIPLKKGLGGVIFYDGGNVYDRINFRRLFNDYSNTVGFGIRYQTPVGPVRIDIGRNLNPVTGLKSTQIFVTLGQSF